MLVIASTAKREFMPLALLAPSRFVILPSRTFGERV